MGLGSAAGILALVFAPWWVLDVGFVGAGAAGVWWARSMPMQQLLTPRLRLRLLPPSALGLGSLAAFAAHQFVGRISLLFMAFLLASGTALLVIRWHGLVEDS